jgi:hypothetical protein
MKLYIKNYKPTDILKKIKLLDDYYLSTKKSIEIISDDGIFNIDEKNFYKINIILDKLVELRSSNLELLLDKTTINNVKVNHLPLNHINFCIISFCYAINSKSKIKLIIEGKYETSEYETSEYKITNKYQNFIPANFYFEIPNEKTNFEILNNEDLNVFLSILN